MDRKCLCPPPAETVEPRTLFRWRALAAVAIAVGVLTVFLFLRRTEAAPPGAAPKPPGVEHPAELQFPPTKGVYQVLVSEAIDGDTVRFYWLVPDTARLAGINTPELHGPTAKAGRDAKAFLERQLSSRPMVARAAGREKYGRALIELFTVDGKPLAELMIEAGHAVGYDGKGPRQ